MVEAWYTQYKPLLFSLSYRMLGSVMDAEDIVQDTFLSLKNIDIHCVRDIKSYLCKAAIHRSINHLKSAKSQREVYVGPWLPEPIVTDDTRSDDPVEYVVERESLSMAFVFMLQQMSEVERAVFLLREALAYDYEEIGDIVGKSSTNCRQIFHRAKHRLRDHPVGASWIADTDVVYSDWDFGSVEVGNHYPTSGPARKTVEAFLLAFSTGDMNALMKVLSTNAVVYSDGGGKVTAALRPIVGCDKVIRFLEGLVKKMNDGYQVAFVHVNGEPGFISYLNDAVYGVISFDVRNDQIHAIYFVLNPDKLRHVGTS